MNLKVSKKYTSEEIEFLKENYPKLGAKYCSEKLGRTVRAIRKICEISDIKFDSKYTKEILSNIVSSSKTMVEVLCKLNLRPAGGNHKNIKKYILLHQLDTSHFNVKRADIKGVSKYKLNEILIKNSAYKNNVLLKERLYKEGLKKRMCEMCDQNEVWNGKKMSLILDHKNGIHNDNRIENLRIVCPNCNATLETHCRKNKIAV